jgi:uncharacterized protein (TIGR03083 family)
MPTPLHLADLLPKLDALLIELLEGLSATDWERQTLAGNWSIKDVAAHLLDGNLRTLSMLRDGYAGETPGPISSYRELVDFLNQMNADWVKATRRLSPKIVIELLKRTGEEYCDYLQTLDPDAQAVWPVAWAGESESKNWFHIAREYTEKWHHQQQIRYALDDADGELLKLHWYLPYLDTSVRALPYHYRAVEGAKGDVIRFVFMGEGEKNWFLLFEENWSLYRSMDAKPTCEVRIPDEYAWRMFTKGISREEAIRKSQITGKSALGMKIFDMLAIMG